MVVTRQSTHRDAGETGEESHLESPPDTNPAPVFFQPPSTFVFQPPSQMNTADEFDIAEDTDSVQYDSEAKETASEITEVTRRSDASPSRGGSEVTRLMASLHDLSRQMEVTMEDLRTQFGHQLGNQSWPAGDYDVSDQNRLRENTSTQRFKRITTAVSHTWRGVVCRLVLLRHMICQRFPATTDRLADLGRTLRPFLSVVGYVLLAHIAYGVYATHKRLVERQKRQATPWL